MQYLLSETEYNVLVGRQEVRLKVATKQLQDICTLAANHVPVIQEWSPDATPSPWGCILTLGGKNQDGYCDCCPSKHICPFGHKNYSK
jgi:hypothetical protein